MKNGEDLEKNVERIYKLLGARTTERRKLIESYEIDVYASFENGPIEYRVIVECKEYGHDRKVTDADMTTFIAKLLLAKTKKMAEIGVFVTTSDFTMNARKSAEDHNITCLTLEQLYNKLVEFKYYIGDVQLRFEESDLAKYYIEQRGSMIEDYVSLLKPELDAVTQYPLADYLIKLLYEEKEKRIAVLGNLGTGKTSLCHVLLNRLIKEYNNDTKRRIPLLINLRDFRSGLDIDELVTNHLQKLPGISVNLQLCKELQKMGRFVFIFDGLDEMASKVDRIVINENLRELDKLYSEGDNHYIITCRTHFFQEKISDEFLTDYKVLYLTGWTNDELEEYLQKRFPSTKEQLLKKIRSHPAIRELARTPIFLDMILSSISNIPDNVELDIPMLYKTYTDEWIEKQSKRRGAVMSQRQRTKFVTELSSLIYLSDLSKIHFTTLYNVSREISGYIDNTRIDYFDTDARTSTFITKDGEGNYSFFHPSFMEFFCAERIVAEINDGNSTLLAHKEVSVEIIAFISLSNIADRNIENLERWSKSFGEEKLSRNAVQLLLRLNKKLDKEVEKFYNINNADWKELDEALDSDDVNVINDFIAKNYQKMDHMIRTIRIRQRLDLDYSDWDVEQIISDLFIKLWGEKHLQKKSISHKALNSDLYLYNTLKKIIRDKSRTKKLSQTYKSDFDEKVVMSLTDGDRYEDPFDESESLKTMQLKAIYDALQSLPEHSRKIFLSVYRNGHSINKVAVSFGLSRSSVVNILHRIRSRIREMIMYNNQDLF